MRDYAVAAYQQIRSGMLDISPVLLSYERKYFLKKFKKRPISE